MDDNPEIRDRLNVNKSTYHNKRPRERFICFIRGAKWMKINQLNGPSPIHDTSTWLSQSIQSIRHVCCRLGMQKNLPWKLPACRRLLFPLLQASQQVLPSKLDACANVTTCWSRQADFRVRASVYWWTDGHNWARCTNRTGTGSYKPWLYPSNLQRILNNNAYSDRFMQNLFFSTPKLSN